MMTFCFGQKNLPWGLQQGSEFGDSEISASFEIAFWAIDPLRIHLTKNFIKQKMSVLMRSIWSVAADLSPDQYFKSYKKTDFYVFSLIN